MDVNSFKTISTKPAEVDHKWYLIDGENQVVGRLASQVAAMLRGKHKPSFTPHVDTGDYIVIINADKVRFTGAKESDKSYYKHSGYPGGLTSISPKDVRVKKPTFMVDNAVKGMLPKGSLGRQMIKKLKTYAGTDHPHEAQQPELITL